MLSIRGLAKPQYLLRPSQILRRVLRELRRNPRDGQVLLPWGLELTLDPADTVSDALLGQGIYDLVTTEILWRLTEPGDRTADVGANVGYMTSMPATRAGASGSVLAFELHPKTFSILESNAVGWNTLPNCARTTAMNGAISDRDGTAKFAERLIGDVNASPAFLTDDALPSNSEVRVWRLADFMNEGGDFGVFAGIGDALACGRIRDIVYEEEAGYPAQSHTLLENAGYTIFAFQERLRGPEILPATAMTAPKRFYEVLPSYLATRDLPRARKLLARPGWQCLIG